MIVNGEVKFVSSPDLCDYSDFVVASGKEEVFYRSIIGFFKENGWNKVRLNSIPDGSPTLTHLPQLAENKKYSIKIEEADVAPICSLPSSWERYLQTLSKKNRHEIRRKIRNIGNHSAYSRYVFDPIRDDIDECFTDFIRLHKGSSIAKTQFMTPGREDFFFDMFSELAQRDELRLEFLILEDKRVACCVGFDYADSYLLYNSGYDPQYSDLSVGFVNKVLALEGSISAGRRTFDFLRGSERYKYQLGGVDRPVYNILLHNEAS